MALLTELYKALWDTGEAMTIANGFQFDWKPSKDRLMRETPMSNPVFFIALMDDDEELENKDYEIGGGGAQSGRMFNTIPMFLYIQTPIRVDNSTITAADLQNYNNSYYSEYVGNEGLQDAIRAFDMLGPLADMLCPYIEEIRLINAVKIFDPTENETNTIRYKIKYEIDHSMERFRA